MKITNFAGALQGIATTTLRAVIGDILLDDVLSRREQINEVLRAKLDEATERWGGKVTTVEIREIIPPRDVQEAMNRQLSAERTRRAVITESEGTRQARSTWPRATSSRTSFGPRASASRRSCARRASRRPWSGSTGRPGVDQKTMALQYLEALKSLGLSPATKFVIPLEFTKLIEPFTSYVERSGQPSDSGGTGGAAPGRARLLGQEAEPTPNTTVGSTAGSVPDGSGGSVVRPPMAPSAARQRRAQSPSGGRCVGRQGHSRRCRAGNNGRHKGQALTQIARSVAVVATRRIHSRWPFRATQRNVPRRPHRRRLLPSEQR